MCCILASSGLFLDVNQHLNILSGDCRAVSDASHASKQVVLHKTLEDTRTHHRVPFHINTALREEDHFTRSPWLRLNRCGRPHKYAGADNLPGVWISRDSSEDGEMEILQHMSGMSVQRIMTCAVV